MFIFKYVYHNTDDHIKKGKGGEENKAQIKNPRQRVDRHGFVHNIGPVFKGHHPEQGQHGDGNIPPQHIIDGFKKGGADSRVNIINNKHQQQDIAQLWQRAQQRVQQHTQFRDDRYHPQHAENTHQTTNKSHIAVIDRNQTDNDDQGIKQVPAIMEEAFLIRCREKADNDFDQENNRNAGIQPVQHHHQRVGNAVGFGTDQKGRKNNDGYNKEFEGFVITNGLRSGL